MTNLARCHVPLVPVPVHDVHVSEIEVFNDVVGLRKFLFGRALMLTQDPSTAEDLVQNTLEKALAARVSFRPGTNLKAWLSVILRRRFIDDCRHARVERRIERELARDGELVAAPLPNGLDPRDLLAVDDVVACLAGLSARDREVFELFHLRRLSYRQIAAELGIPGATVGTRIHRAMRRVRALLARTLATRSATLIADARVG